MSPVHRAEVQAAGVPPHEHVVIHFPDVARLRAFAASLAEMADSADVDHVHLQDQNLSKDHPDAGVEIVFVKNKKDWNQIGNDQARGG